MFRVTDQERSMLSYGRKIESAFGEWNITQHEIEVFVTRVAQQSSLAADIEEMIPIVKDISIKIESKARSIIEDISSQVIFHELLH